MIREILFTEWVAENHYRLINVTATGIREWDIEVGCRNFNYKIISIETNDTSTNKDKPEEHGNGEYQIEAIIQKL